MGALAFLFSLVSQSDASASKGLPVAILDEVDAPLDESNIRRFCSFVERLAAEGTQFVLITHQKATFEVADAIWGVTTQEVSVGCLASDVMRRLRLEGDQCC